MAREKPSNTMDADASFRIIFAAGQGESLARSRLTAES
jgi:hypothetical protein